jgi:hypothetical protein
MGVPEVAVRDVFILSTRYSQDVGSSISNTIQRLAIIYYIKKPVDSRGSPV